MLLGMPAKCVARIGERVESVKRDYSNIQIKDAIVSVLTDGI